MPDCKIVLVAIFLGVAICDPRNSGYSTTTSSSNYIENWNGTFIVPSNATAVKDKVEIKVYYETLCQFSVDFFVQQLEPALKRLPSHLDIHLIPYGHAETIRANGGYKFNCQHGVPECFGNTLQACAIDVLKNTTKVLPFNTCLMRNISYRTSYSHVMSVINWCGAEHDVHVQDIWRCVHSRRGSYLLKRYGDETHAVAPAFVPYLTIDGTTLYQEQALNNLVATVCQMLTPKPRECLTD
nr:gamma-interferon-inducible lysosomal thiol reductase [Helicoverpa armigera]